METAQFTRAARAFSRLEQTAVKQGKFQSLTELGKYHDIAVLAVAQLSSLGDRIFWLRLNGHRLIEYHYYLRAKTFLEEYYTRGRKRKNFKGAYESLAQVCLAAKELYDNGY